MDFHTLRQAGIRHLERLIGGRWTDFNVHDPGITILEQLCYALTDLGYRITHDLPDLLAEGGADPYESLYQPAQILTTQPVTVMDLRTLLLDVEGVRNAWIEPLWHDPIEEQEIALHYLPEQEELRHGPASNGTSTGAEAIKLKGLYRVLIENADPAHFTAATVRARVAQRLHANRGLCEDFAEVRVLEPQWIRVQARVEIAAVDNVEEVLARILEGITHHISPPIPFAGNEQLQAAQRSAEPGTATKAPLEAKAIDQLFDGPLLAKGFLDPETLQQAQRRTTLQTSDLIQKMMDVPGVLAIRTLSISAEGEAQAWSLRLDPTRAPALDLAGSQIVLERDRIRAGVDFGQVVAAQQRRQQTQADSTPCLGATIEVAEEPSPLHEGLTPPCGRDRQVGNYDSIQHQFPAAYGIGDLGLPATAPPERTAQARQLKAYLMFFDQLLANTFAQLAHLKDLFSFHDEHLKTAFAMNLEDPTLGLEDLFTHDPETHAERLREITQGPQGRGRSLEHKNRFLNHLLARFAEQFTEYALVLFEATPSNAAPTQLLATPRIELLAEKLARDKQAFLRRYPRISSARGTGRNCLRSETSQADRSAPPREANVSGLEERVRLKLGFISAVGEDLALVEHILLRPGGEDQQQQVPLLAAPLSKDPYSLQLSFVLPQAPERFQNPSFRRFIEQTIREETPVHLMPYVHWLPPSAWGEFSGVHREWLRRRREILCETYGTPESVPQPGPGQPPRLETLHLRAVRDRLLDLLEIGETFPLQDAVAEQIVATATSEASRTHKILVWPGPSDVRYELCNPAGQPVTAASRYLPGHTAGHPPWRPLGARSDASTPIACPQAVGAEPDCGKILARKLSTGREAYLHQRVDLDLVSTYSAANRRRGLGKQQLGITLAVGTASEMPAVARSCQATELVVVTDPLGLRHSAGLGRLRLGVDLAVGASPFDPWRRPGLGQMQAGIDLAIAGGLFESGLCQTWLGVDLVVGDDDDSGAAPFRASRS